MIKELMIGNLVYTTDDGVETIHEVQSIVKVPEGEKINGFAWDYLVLDKGVTILIKDMYAYENEPEYLVYGIPLTESLLLDCGALKVYDSAAGILFAHFIEGVKIYKEPSEYKGGQQCGFIARPIILESEELALKMELGYYRSDNMNRELILTIFNLILDEVIK